MAFKDIQKFLYGGTIDLYYKDSTHVYTVKRLDPATGAWEKLKRPASATGLLGATLEKDGLQLWPMGLALRYLLGFYDFKNDEGERRTGFSEGVGVLWEQGLGDPDAVLEACLKAQNQHILEKNKGADIGTIVHDAIAEHIAGTPFDITLDIYREKQLEKKGELDAEFEDRAPGEIVLANQAFGAWRNYWDHAGIEVKLSEEILYSKEWNLAGTMDRLQRVPGKGLVIDDNKTTKASVRSGAPKGVYYNYFIQDGLYACMLVEMGVVAPGEIADMSITSCRKDGGFDVVYASDLGLTPEDCMDWARSVVHCYQMMRKTKQAITKAAGTPAEED